MPSQIDKLVEAILKKVYAKKPGKLKKHAKKMSRIRKKQKNNKKNALHNQFKYCDKLLRYNQAKLGLRKTNIYNKRRQNALRRLPPQQVQRVWNDTNVNSYNDIPPLYLKVLELDGWVQQQQRAYNQYNQQNNNG